MSEKDQEATERESQRGGQESGPQGDQTTDERASAEKQSDEGDKGGKGGRDERNVGG